MPVVGSSAFPLCSDVFSLIRSLLNDADVPSTSIITPSGLSRTTDVVTLTTQSAHGLQVGNYIQVLNADDPTFNGTFQIPLGGVVSSTQIQYAQTASDATSGNGVVQLVIQGDVYTDTVLLPFVNSAYRKVQIRLGMAGSKTTTGIVVLSLAAGATELDDSTSPQLPTDFLAPRIIKERITGQLYFGNPMRQVNILPSGPQQAFNYCFSWQDEALAFPGATNALDLELRYIKTTLNVLTDGTSQILIRGASDAVSFYGAYLAARSRGSSQTAALKNDFEESIGELKNMQAHARGYVPGRRRCYGRGGRSSGSGNNSFGSV